MRHDEPIFENGELAELQQRMAADPAFCRRAREALARSAFRAPCAEDEGALLRIRGEEFPVVNIGPKGVGFLVAREDRFALDAVLADLELVIDEHRFHFRGRVVHVSPAEDDRWLVGVEILDLASGDEETIHALVLDRRRRLFATADQAPDEE